MRVYLTPEAVERFEIVNAWWMSNSAQPSLFVEEVADAIELLEQHPRMGSLYKTSPRGEIRRVLLPKTRQYLYYQPRLDEGAIEVKSFWGTARGSRPPL